MEISPKQALIAAGVVLALMLGMVAFWTIDKRAHEAQIVQLQNEIASRDKTIETQKGVYQRLALQSQDLTKLIGDKDKELKALKDQLKKQGAELLTANTLVVKLKKELEAHHDGPVVTPDPEKPGVKVALIDTGSQMDPFQVTGKVQVDCDAGTSVVDLKLRQCRPLNISVVVSQDKDGTWRTSATSSIDNFGVDITLAAVNPYILEPRWYEKIGLSADVGVGTGPGFLAGVGVHYQIGKFEVGPKAWVVIDRAGVNPFFGANLLWHPFQR